ncbi:60S ribosomal protein L39 [Blastocladiella emersonii ATCC 22665]|nr:60S ribosomal protein L39 [Blastocladiella emersonii ATCC 22665]
MILSEFDAPAGKRAFGRPPSLPQDVLGVIRNADRILAALNAGHEGERYPVKFRRILTICAPVDPGITGIDAPAADGQFHFLGVSVPTDYAGPLGPFAADVLVRAQLAQLISDRTSSPRVSRLMCLELQPDRLPQGEGDSDATLAAMSFDLNHGYIRVPTFDRDLGRLASIVFSVRPLGNQAMDVDAPAAPRQRRRDPQLGIEYDLRAPKYVQHDAYDTGERERDRVVATERTYVSVFRKDEKNMWIGSISYGSPQIVCGQWSKGQSRQSRDIMLGRKLPPKTELCRLFKVDAIRAELVFVALPSMHVPAEDGAPAARAQPRRWRLCPARSRVETFVTTTMPSNKTFKIKRVLGKKQRQNRPIPQWIRLRTDNTIRYNAKRRNWRRTKLNI